MASETQEQARTTFWGQVLVFSAHGGSPDMAGRALVALKMANEAEIMERMIRLQLKFTPRRANFAMRTRVLIFCKVVSLAAR